MYGVEAASKFYFGKSAIDLTLEESAVITAIAKGPSIYSPVDHPEKSTKEKNLFYRLMKAQGLYYRGPGRTCDGDSNCIENRRMG